MSSPLTESAVIAVIAGIVGFIVTWKILTKRGGEARQEHHGIRTSSQREVTRLSKSALKRIREPGILPELSGTQDENQRLAKDNHNEGEVFSRLLLKVFGDRKKAERLIEFERKRAPGKTEEQLIEAAIERLENDKAR